MLDGSGDNAGAPRLANALRAAMGLAGYGTLVLPKGEGMGVACVSSQERKTSSWTACAAHVAVAADGTVKVKKLTVASDVGTAVNPDGVRAQMMGATLWGMSLAMLEKATMKDGAIEQTNFDSYTPMRMADMPGDRGRDHRQWRNADGHRRASGHGRRAGDRQRHLQRCRRPRARPADHRRGGQSGDEEGLTKKGRAAARPFSKATWNC